MLEDHLLSSLPGYSRTGLTANTHPCHDKDSGAFSPQANYTDRATAACP
jgi:hypothetical protein